MSEIRNFVPEAKLREVERERDEARASSDRWEGECSVASDEADELRVERDAALAALEEILEIGPRALNDVEMRVLMRARALLPDAPEGADG